MTAQNLIFSMISTCIVVKRVSVHSDSFNARNSSIRLNLKSVTTFGLSLLTMNSNLVKIMFVVQDVDRFSSVMDDQSVDMSFIDEMCKLCRWG